MDQDRTYWRAQDDKRLIDEAKYYPSVELCIALAERLQDAIAAKAFNDKYRDDDND